MNIESLEKRIKELEESIQQGQQQLQQLNANLIAMDGAKQDCLWWLEELKKPKAEEEKPEDAV